MAMKVVLSNLNNRSRKRKMNLILRVETCHKTWFNKHSKTHLPKRVIKKIKERKRILKYRGTGAR